MRPDDYIRCQFSTWGVPRSHWEDRLSDPDLPMVILKAIEPALPAVYQGKFPPSLGLCGDLTGQADRALVALAAQVLESHLESHPGVLEQEEGDLRGDKRFLWVAWPVLGSELSTVDLRSTRFQTLSERLERMATVPVLFVTGLGEAVSSTKYEDSLKAILTTRAGDKLRTYWTSPLGLDEVLRRYRRTGIEANAVEVNL